MAVSGYTRGCSYTIPRLKKEVHLINGEDVDIFVDGENIHASYTSGSLLSFKCLSITLEEEESVDGRYAFEHKVEFTVQGHVNYSTLSGFYYVVVVAEDGTPFLVNPFFPAKVSFTYTLSNGVSETEFQFGTVSNYPVMKLAGFTSGGFDCVDFSYPRVSHLLINEKNYTSGYSANIAYTNDGFKKVDPKNNSITVKETFDGDNAIQEVSFTIPFDGVQPSWSYHLLEFKENRYCAVVVLDNGDWILAGFGNGLEPSYSIHAEGSEVSDISVSLSNDWNSDNHLIYIEGGLMVPLTELEWKPVPRGSECVDWNKAVINLKAEQDLLGNGTGRYMARTGKKGLFPDLNLVDETFDEIMYFQTSQCAGFECFSNFNPPQTIVFNSSGDVREWTMESNVDWWIVPASTAITVSPASGSANVEYTVTMTNNIEPTSTPFRTTVDVFYCGKSKTYNVVVSDGAECFTSGLEYNISPEGQTVQIPAQCCITGKTVHNGSISNYKYVEGNYVTFYVPANNSASTKTFYIDFGLCSGKTVRVTINQAGMYTEWRTIQTICKDSQLCDFQVLYSGSSSGDVSTKTDLTRYYNCRSWSGCTKNQTRYVTSQDITCYNAVSYYVEYEQYTTDNGSTWIATGNYRLGAQAYVDSICQGAETYVKWEADGYQCDGANSYVRERQYISDDNIDWTETDIYRQGDMIVENDTRCGYELPSDEYEEDWRTADGYLCDGTDKHVRERLWRRKSGTTDNFVATDIYRVGYTIIESDSYDCGYDPNMTGYTYTDWRSTGSYTCNGYDKYPIERKYVSNDNVNWTATNITRLGSVAVQDSADCGYVPVPVYTKWENVDGFLCDGTTKYTKQQAYTSYDGVNWYEQDSFRRGEVITTGSTDCGFNDNDWEYRWVLSDEWQCGNDAVNYIFREHDTQQTTINVTGDSQYHRYAWSITSTLDGNNVEWSPSGAASWLNVSKGDNYLVCEVSANEGALRTTSFQIVQNGSGKVINVNVTQGSKSGVNYYFAFPSGATVVAYSAPYTSGSTSFDITSTADGSFHPYVADTPSWLSGTTGETSLTVSWSENCYIDGRTNVLRFVQADSQKEVFVMVNQEGYTGGTFTFTWADSTTAKTTTFTDGKIKTFQIISDYGCGHPDSYILSEPDWVIASINQNFLALTVKQNTTGSPRTGQVVIAQTTSGNQIVLNVTQN